MAHPFYPDVSNETGAVDDECTDHAGPEPDEIHFAPLLRDPDCGPDRLLRLAPAGHCYASFFPDFSGAGALRTCVSIESLSFDGRLFLYRFRPGNLMEPVFRDRLYFGIYTLCSMRWEIDIIMKNCYWGGILDKSVICSRCFGNTGNTTAHIDMNFPALEYCILQFLIFRSEFFTLHINRRPPVQPDSCHRT